MFRHRGRKRSFKDNLRISAFLSFTAGIVNICGVLALGVLTTNVTGHFAYFSAAMQKHDFLYAFNFLFYILSFLSGSFLSSLITEYYLKKNVAWAHKPVIILEIVLLVLIGIGGNLYIKSEVQMEWAANFLLFAMGLQNAQVTSISNASVRTTHLTGLFTDLGIELSQLFYYREEGQARRLKKSIGLRFNIIAFFFSGCFIGSFVFLRFQLKTLLFASFILMIALVYDLVRLWSYRIYKRFRDANIHQH
jgi:uncharacterized membrane protein YoaK (UPF0700 family)